MEWRKRDIVVPLVVSATAVSMGIGVADSLAIAGSHEMYQAGSSGVYHVLHDGTHHVLHDGAHGHGMLSGAGHGGLDGGKETIGVLVGHNVDPSVALSPGSDAVYAYNAAFAGSSKATEWAVCEGYQWGVKTGLETGFK